MVSCLEARAAETGRWRAVVRLGALALAYLLSSHPSTLPTAEGEDGIPPVIEGQVATHYSLVSADAAVTPNGEIRHEHFVETGLLSPGSTGDVNDSEPDSTPVKLIEDQDCKGRRFMEVDPSPSATSATELVRDASLVFAGRVVAMAQGFSESFPGTLLEVEVHELLKASAEWEVVGSAYVYYPYARFSILGETFCTGVLPEWYRIKAGDGVLVVARGVPTDLYNRLAWSPGWGVVFEDSASGRVVGDRQLETVIARNLAGGASDDLLRL